MTGFGGLNERPDIIEAQEAKAKPLTHPLPSMLPHAAVQAAFEALGIAHALDRIKTVTLGWGGVRVEIYAEGPDGRSVRSVDGNDMAIDVITIPVV